MKLKTRILLLFLAISIIPIIVITVFVFSRYTKLTNEQTTQVVDNIVNNAVNSISDTLDEVNKLTSIFQTETDNSYSLVDDIKKYSVNSSDYTAFDLWTSRNNIKYICQNFLYSNSYINGIFVFTPNGENFGWGNGIDIRPGYKPMEDDWYKDTLSRQGTLYISDLSTKKFILKSEDSIFFSKALYDVYTREFLGVILIDCSPTILDLSSVNTLPDTLLITISRDNTEDKLYTNQNNINYEISQLSNEEKIYKDVVLEKWGLKLTTVTNLSELTDQFQYTKDVLIIFSMGCALIIIVIAFLMSAYVTKPIVHLSNHMRNIKDQGLTTTQKYKNRNDEIGILYTEHDTMVNSLNQYIKNEYQNKLITLDAQMRALEAQINSHFLFNTLESINSIAEIEEVESISIMSLALGNMFRYSIKTKSELVSLQDELKHVQDYVSIQLIRFNSNFQILYDIQEGIIDTKILKLILQPLVENALYHGLNRCSIKGIISLSAHIEENVVIIKLEDTGKGIPLEQLGKIKEMLNKPPQFTELGHREQISIGLKNIHTRIQLYYGTNYGLSIESIEGKGTSILIKVPIVERGDINV